MYSVVASVIGGEKIVFSSRTLGVAVLWAIVHLSRDPWSIMFNGELIPPCHQNN